MCWRLPKVHHDFILWLAKWTSVGIHVSVQPEEGSAVLFLRPIGIKHTAVCGSNGCLKHLWSMHKEIWIVRKCSINRKTSKLHIVFSGTIEIGDWVARRQDSAKLWPVGRGGLWLLLSQLHSNCTGRTSPWPFYGFWPWRASIHAAFWLVNLALSVQTTSSVYWESTRALVSHSQEASLICDA